MTTAIQYQDLVQKTFCKNAIRSVMLIDDQFIPYPDLIDSFSKNEKIDQEKVITSQRAALLEKFFQNEKILCDIDNSIGNLDVERIRKSDLLIIDYQLEEKNPSKTLKILCELKNSKHFNLAVVYTSENPETVWKQIAASFNPIKNIEEEIEKIEEFDEFWDEEILPSIQSGSIYSLTNKELIDYIILEKNSGRLKGILSKNPKFKDKKDEISNIICDYSLGINQIYQCSENTKTKIEGDTNGKTWIKSGNVFVCIYQKSPENFDEDPTNIWNALTDSLVNWQPSYYQLIQSEIQNHIESDSMAFNRVHDNDKHGQAAWLNEVLKPENQTKTPQFIKNIYADISEELAHKFLNNEELSSFINSTFNLYKDNFDPAPGKHLTEFCCEQMKLPFYANKTNKDMYHALNMHLSSKDYREKHISTGTVLYDQVNETWYLCVSPACDMVPTQETAPINKRLTPHRMIQVLTLFNVSAEEALENATRSKYIYAYDNEQRLYFSVTNPVTDLPVSDYLVIVNYKTKLDERYHEALTFKANGEDIDRVRISLKLKSQLRSGYAERFQNMASHHSGRIGVDFIKGFEPPVSDPQPLLSDLV